MCIFDGAKLFELKNTHGFPLEIALDKIINENKMRVSWVDFIEKARKSGWQDFKTIDAIKYALEDAGVDKDAITQILDRSKLYMMKEQQHGGH